MSKQIHNDHALTRYLLGALPDAEAERLDELGFTDDEFAESLKAAEKDLVDAYVQGELTGPELEQFKSYYLASPLRREKVAFARALHLVAERNAGVQASGVPAETQAQPKAKRSGSWFAFLGFVGSPGPTLQWGAVFAALALMVAGGWLLFQNVRLRQQMSETQARKEAVDQREQELQKKLEDAHSASVETAQELARVRAERERLEQELKLKEDQRQTVPGGRPGGDIVASFVLTPQRRSAGQIRTISIPAETGYVAMRLALEPVDFPAYRVELLDQTSNRTLWRSNRLKASASRAGKALDIRFRAGLLEAQKVYVLRSTGVSANGNSEIIGDYPFRVVK